MLFWCVHFLIFFFFFFFPIVKNEIPSVRNFVSFLSNFFSLYFKVCLKYLGGRIGGRRENENDSPINSKKPKKKKKNEIEKKKKKQKNETQGLFGRNKPCCWGFVWERLFLCLSGAQLSSSSTSSSSALGSND